MMNNTVDSSCLCALSGFAVAEQGFRVHSAIFCMGFRAKQHPCRRAMFGAASVGELGICHAVLR